MRLYWILDDDDDDDDGGGGGADCGSGGFLNSS
jgi:hypothetical protein